MVKEVDKAAQSLLKNLEDKRIPKLLSLDKIFTNHVKFGECGIDPNVNTTHEQYLTKFCQDFHTVIKSDIEVGNVTKSCAINVKKLQGSFLK